MNDIVNWDDINWDVLKIEYELFGKSVEDINLGTNIPIEYLNNYIKEHEWKLHPQAMDVSTNRLVKETDDYTTHVKNKLEKLSALKQEIFAPEYLKLEFNLIIKANQILEGIKKEDTNASSKIKAIASVFKELISSNGMLASSAEDASKSGNKLVVQIVTKVENGDNKTAIQIQSQKLPD